MHMAAGSDKQNY